MTSIKIKISFVEFPPPPPPNEENIIAKKYIYKKRNSAGDFTPKKNTSEAVDLNKIPANWKSLLHACPGRTCKAARCVDVTQNSIPNTTSFNDNEESR